MPSGEWTDGAFPVLDAKGIYSTSGACSVSPFTTTAATITRGCAAIRYAIGSPTWSPRPTDREPPTNSEHVRAALRGIRRTVGAARIGPSGGRARASARAGRLGGRGSTRWRRCGRASSSRFWPPTRICVAQRSWRSKVSPRVSRETPEGNGAGLPGQDGALRAGASERGAHVLGIGRGLRVGWSGTPGRRADGAADGGAAARDGRRAPPQAVARSPLPTPLS
jgi:hypothetical protein